MDNLVNNNIGIILARSGSKRIAKKNILDFGGKPLVAWTIEAAINSKIFDKVLLSTDSDEIAKIGIKFGAEVPFLRDGANDDYSSSSKATYHALNQAENFWNTEFTTVAQLMANCPLRDQFDIQKSYKAFIESNSPSQISCFEYGWMNPWWANQISELGLPEPIFNEKMKFRSQDLPKLFCPSGAIWFAKRESFCTTKDFYMKNHRFEPITWMSAIDIDESNDLMMAKAFLKIKNESTL